MIDSIPTGQKLTQKVHRQYLLREAEHFRDHKIGIPEWIKNSDDSYVRHEECGDDFSNLPIIVNFNRDEIFCIDFGGADGKDVIEHVPYYGSPVAASHGKKLKRDVSGGHGNGGKFYGLAQFNECQVINYYNKKLTIITLKEEADYVNFENKTVEPRWVIDFLGIGEWSYFKEQKDIFEAILEGKLNVFCWRGIRPKDRVSKKTQILKIIEAVTKNPQARPALNTRIVDVLAVGQTLISQLEPMKINVDTVAGERNFVLPNELGGYRFNKNSTSTLKVIFSKDPLTGDSASLNILEILVNGKPKGYHYIPSLLFDKGISKYMYASIDCPELKDYKCISNERRELIPNHPISDLFIDWCKNKLREVLLEQTDKQMRKDEEKNLEKVSEFVNEVIQDLSELLEQDALTQTFSEKSEKIGVVDTPTDKPGGYGGKHRIIRPGGGTRTGKIEKTEAGVTEKPKKSKLRIKISNKDEDPLHPGQTYAMIERQPILYQRQEDFAHGIWWINSQKEYVRKLKIDQPAGRAFFCFLVKEVVLSSRVRQKFQENDMDPDRFEELDFDLIDKVFNKVISRLSIDISDETLTEKMRKVIRSKERFTISELAKETGIEPTYISVFLNDPKNGIKKSFRIDKCENPHGKGPSVNIYIKKSTDGRA